MQTPKTASAISALLPGDVLLCFSDPKNDFFARKIVEKVGGPYCHAAIFYGNGVAAETRALNRWRKGQVVKIPVEMVIARYNYVAVIRQPDAWSTPERVASLQGFIDGTVARSAKYNFLGAYLLPKLRQAHQLLVMDKIRAYFDGAFAPQPAQKVRYFCSEFVCDCFAAVGFFHPSARVFYEPSTFAPSDLAKDPSFGTFLGYLSIRRDYDVSADDPFVNATTYDEIFGFRAS